MSLLGCSIGNAFALIAFSAVARLTTLVLGCVSKTGRNIEAQAGAGTHEEAGQEAGAWKFGAHDEESIDDMEASHADTTHAEEAARDNAAAHDVEAPHAEQAAKDEDAPHEEVQAVFEGAPHSEVREPCGRWRFRR